MSTLAVHNTIRTRFRDLIEQPRGVAVQYDNGVFTKPETGPWVNFSIRCGTPAWIEFGAVKTKRTVGIATAMIFVPLDEGDAEALDLADFIDQSFAPSTIDGVSYRTVEIRTIGESRGVWQVNAIINFYFDEFR